MKKMYFLYRAKQLETNSNILRVLFHSMIKSHLLYCLSIFGSKVTKLNEKRINSILKQAIKINANEDLNLKEILTVKNNCYATKIMTKPITSAI